jgi:release factor glutamine methyltransferase
VSEFKKLVEKRRLGKPIAYITGRQEFFGHNIMVNKNVLIPRPETEEVVENAISENLKSKCNLFVDVGTGSGCIAIALAKSERDTQIMAMEHCKKAIKVAKQNIENHQLTKQILLIESDLFSKFPKKEYKTKKIIIANLPYIGTESNNFIADEVKKNEPKKALFGGKDGLELYEKLLMQIVKKDITFQAMFFEIGFSQTEEIEKIIKTHLPKTQIKILTDMAGFPRTVKITPK